VTHRTAATRYARALLDVALKENADLSRIEAELAGFVDLLATHRDLEQALLNPAVPAPRKRGAVAELTAKANTQPVLAKLLVLLAERDRLALLPDLLATYRQRLLDIQNVVRAEVTTASPLEADRAREIERGLARATGRTVQLSTRVDSAIVGGIVTRIGSTVYDGSITNHLRRVRQRLLAETRG
jgi:F-type H+-transporting ATPase subunit delta